MSPREGANLKGANLKGAHLKSANLNGSNLEGAYLWHANFTLANLRNAYLNGAYLNGANLNGAYLFDAENLTPKQIKSACNWEKAFYKSEYDEEKFEWVVDEKANLKYIKELEASNPEKLVDCSRWEVDSLIISN